MEDAGVDVGAIGSLNPYLKAEVRSAVQGKTQLFHRVRDVEPGKVEGVLTVSWSTLPSFDHNHVTFESLLMSISMTIIIIF